MRAQRTCILEFQNYLSLTKRSISLQIPKNRLKTKEYWDDINNQREFLEIIAKQVGINSLSDWKNITVTHIKNYGGRKLLNKYNNITYK